MGQEVEGGFWAETALNTSHHPRRGLWSNQGPSGPVAQDRLDGIWRLKLPPRESGQQGCSLQKLRGVWERAVLVGT